MMSTLEMLNAAEADLEWFQNNFGAIQEKYAQQIAAVKDKRIVAWASTLQELFNILKKEHIDEEEVLIETIPPKGEILIL